MFSGVGACSDDFGCAVCVIGYTSHTLAVQPYAKLLWNEQRSRAYDTMFDRPKYGCRFLSF